MDPKTLKKEYSNGEVTVIWQPSLCSHSANCWHKERGLPQVFDPRKKPWISITGSNTSAIVEQVKKCPSGALSYYLNNKTIEMETTNEGCIVEASKNGPLLVHGAITVKDKEGNLVKKEKITAFCRCGGSSNKPYCDGTHRKINFKDE